MRSSFRGAGVLVTLTASLFAQHAAAAGDATDESFYLGFENDVFVGTDNHYTSGLHGEYTSAPGDVPALLTPIRRAIAPLLGDEAEWRAIWGAGQAIFVPPDIRIAAPAADQRPYAGWLYAHIGLAAEREGALDIFRARIGVLGPASLAELVQKRLHRQIGSPWPEGWDTQIGAQPTVDLYYQHIHRFGGRFDIGGAAFRAEFLPHVRMETGNVDTYGALGFTLRIGQNYAEDFGPAARRRGASGGGVATPADGFGWNVFAGVEGRAIAYAGLIEGPLLSKSRDAKPGRLAGDVSVGMALSYGPAELSYTHVIQSKEYAAQPSTGALGYHQYGALNLRVSF